MSDIETDCKHDGATVHGTRLSWCDDCGDVVGTGAAPQSLSTSKVADLLGYSDDAVRRMCERGAFEGAYRPRVGGWWRIPSASVDDFLAQARAVHRRRSRRA